MVDVVTTFTGDYEFLSNFWEAPVSMEILGTEFIFESSEALYQALKHRAMMTDQESQLEYVTACWRADSPGFSKKVGRTVRINSAEWDNIKDQAMRETVFRKFLQNPDECARLLDTGAALLVEGNTWGDTYWGRCEGRGLNRLGSILMEVRGYWVYNAMTNNLPYSEKLDWS